MNTPTTSPQDNGTSDQPVPMRNGKVNRRALIEEVILQERKPDGSLDLDKVQMIARKRIETLPKRLHVPILRHNINQTLHGIRLRENGGISKGKRDYQRRERARQREAPGKSNTTTTTVGTTYRASKTEGYQSQEIVAAIRYLAAMGNDPQRAVILLDTISEPFLKGQIKP